MMVRIFLISLLLAACGSSAAPSTPSSGAPDGAGAADSAAAAGDTAGSQGDATGAGLSASQFSAALALAQCHALHRCDGKSPATCDATASGPWPGLAKAVAAGRTSFDAVQGAACLAALENLPCADATTMSWFPPACRAAVKGSSPVGGACYTSSNCATGYCNAFDVACPGVCVAFASAGGPCTNIGDCDPAAGLVCINKVCSPPPTLGAPCTDNWSCAPSGRYCVEGKCVAAGGAGGPCQSDGECGPTQRCKGQIMYAKTGTCVPATEQGGPCGTTPAEYETEFLQSPTVCAAGLRCRGAIYTFAAEDPASAYTAGTCEVAGAVGAPCTPSPADGMALSGCQDGLACLNGVCALPPSSGPCAPGAWPCAPGTFCNQDQQCAAKKKPGEVCGDSDICLTKCSAAFGETGTCEPEPAKDDKWCQEK